VTVCDVVLTSSIYGEVKIAQPIGPCCLAAALRREGFDVKIVEPSVEGLSVEETAEAILSIPSRIVGVSVHRDSNKPDVLRLARILRQRAPERFLCAGGHGPSVAVGRERGYVTKYTRVTYEEIGRYLDAFVLGEGEETFPGLVRAVLAGEDWRRLPGAAYLRPGAGFQVNPAPPKIENLDEIPFMARDVLELYLDRYGPPVAASLNCGRGCLYDCAFCTVRRYEALQRGRVHRQRSVDSVIREIQLLHERYGVTEFNFEDDNFVVPSRRGTEKLRALCDAIEGLDFDISFTFFCRGDAVDRDLFTRLKRAGLTGVYLGIESVYGPDLEFLGKGISLRQVYDALDILLELGYSPEVGSPLRLMLGYITWHPLTCFEQLRTSSRFFRRYRCPPKLARRALRMYTGVPIKEKLEEMGLLDGSRDSGWRYRDPIFGELEASVNRFFAEVNRTRDRIRTVEKAADRYRRRPDAVPPDLHDVRRRLDALCLDYFDDLLDLAEERGADGRLEDAVRRFERGRWEELAAYVAERGAGEKVDRALDALDLPPEALDLFRK